MRGSEINEFVYKVYRSMGYEFWLQRVYLSGIWGMCAVKFYQPDISKVTKEDIWKAYLITEEFDFPNDEPSQDAINIAKNIDEMTESLAEVQDYLDLLIKHFGFDNFTKLFEVAKKLENDKKEQT